MSKTRILGGFSLVEMMLLLLIVSLIIASGVTVVSKKHVKVPKIAMHGAYMCYYKEGRLHEEKYVGAGLRRKILDRDVTECRFKPPERISYMHIQATGGGGAGGESGYTGGNIVTHKSSTEVISPFGITQDLLDAKGILLSSLRTYGGELSAYVDGSGAKGDAGKGGDAYHIAQNSSSICTKYREWHYQGNEEKAYNCTPRTTNYTVYTKYYDVWDDCQDCWSEKEYCSYNWYSSCDSCTGYTYYEDGVRKCSGSGYRYVTKCGPKYTCRESTRSCSYSSGKINSSWQRTYKNMKVSANDTYTDDYANKAPNPPKYLYELEKATGTAEKKERRVGRDRGQSLTTCSYGNTTKFNTGDGVFGIFAAGEVAGVSCNTGSLESAFGEGIMKLGTGTTSRQIWTTGIASSSVYDRKIEYDPSEENPLAYGKTCVNTAGPGDTCGKTWGNSIPQGGSDDGPSGYRDNPVKSLPYYFSISTRDADYDNCNPCFGYDHCSYRYTNSNTYSQNRYESYLCTFNYQNSSGRECLRTYTPPAKYASYYPAKAAGGNNGKGQKCTVGGVGAGLNLTYKGYSSIIPGIRGSDKNCTNAGYKALYTYNEWQNRPRNCYAENGTDSQGYAYVELNGQRCAVHSAQKPTKGKGGRIVNRTPKAGGSVTEGNGKNGSLDTPGNGKGSYGANHVGYMVKRRDNSVEENYKYKYWYTWDTNYLQYGNGGKAGEYRVKIIRSFKDKDMLITLGQGGQVNGCQGGDGGDTTVGDILVAKGGKGGGGCIALPTEQLPYWYAEGTFNAGANGTSGQKANLSNLKSNIMNLILPVDNSVLQQWMAASGAGGDGGGSRNYCWASEWVKNFEGKDLGESIDAGEVACRTGVYWSATPAATPGQPGAVLIKW